MITRYAEFVGAIHAGRENDFYAFVEERLVPLWTKFEGATAVSVSREVSRDEGAPSMPLLLAISYPDEAALERAMACDARFRSREETRALLTMFDGTIFHRVTRQSSYEVRKAG
ncbi:hypothetical protein [Rhizobium sp. SYY.PMSO]|uniref:hypothetical protein n=1 Tax=Rhizobium sp. SYY.PMSO TaxID=3382192 RepID=UPI00398FE15E